MKNSRKTKEEIHWPSEETMYTDPFDIKFNEFIKVKKIVPKTKICKEIKAVAYHEAGHTVYAAILGMDFCRVTIIPDKEKGSAGSIDVENEYGGTDYFIETDEPELSWNAIKCDMAGIISQAFVTGKFEWERAGTDSGRSLNIAFSSRMDFDLEKFPMQRLWDETIAFFEDDENWEKVEIIAQKLLKKKTLIFDEVFKLLHLERPIRSRELFEQRMKGIKPEVVKVTKEMIDQADRKLQELIDSGILDENGNLIEGK
ncbi:MAG: hypothetical protein M0Q51_11815 [Bacteroidales bacterium]|nr:hypothetical protein [Bacteroidales bacterium]